MTFKKEGFQSGGEPSQAVNAELMQKMQADTLTVTQAAPGGKAAQEREFRARRQPRSQPWQGTPGSSGLKAAA